MHRGGCGGAIGLMLHDTDAPFDWQWFCYGLAFPTSNGLCGGWPTRAVDAKILRNTDLQDRLARSEMPTDVSELEGEVIPFQAKGTYQQLRQNGDFFHCYYQGGAGYGDPIDREPERVLRDVLNRWVSPEVAHDVYGVVLNADGEAVDADATKQRREDILRWRRENAKIRSAEEVTH